jgi:hypothetical protein
MRHLQPKVKHQRGRDRYNGSGGEGGRSAQPAAHAALKDDGPQSDLVIQGEHPGLRDQRGHEDHLQLWLASHCARRQADRPYWEGDIRIKGAIDGKPVHGEGYKQTNRRTSDCAQTAG